MDKTKSNWEFSNHGHLTESGLTCSAYDPAILDTEVPSQQFDDAGQRGRLHLGRGHIKEHPVLKKVMLINHEKHICPAHDFR